MNAMELLDKHKYLIIEHHDQIEVVSQDSNVWYDHGTAMASTEYIYHVVVSYS